MSDDSKSRCLSYKASPFTALVITVMSLFMQWFIWFAYEKLDKEWYFNLVSPLVLCMMYHFVRLDAGKNGNFSGKFLFCFLNNSTSCTGNCGNAADLRHESGHKRV